MTIYRHSSEATFTSPVETVDRIQNTLRPNSILHSHEVLNANARIWSAISQPTDLASQIRASGGR